MDLFPVHGLGRQLRFCKIIFQIECSSNNQQGGGVDLDGMDWTGQPALS